MVTIDRPLKTLHFRRVVKCFKVPDPLNSKKLFGRLKCSPCNLNQVSSAAKSTNRVVLCSNVSIMGGCKPQSSSMTGGLYQNRFYLRILTGIGIDSGENLTSFPLAICIKNPHSEECTVFCGFF